MRSLPVLVHLAVLSTTVLAVADTLADRNADSRASKAIKLPRELNGACYALNTDVFDTNPPVPIALSAADDIIACSQICAFEHGGHLVSPFVGLTGGVNRRASSSASVARLRELFSLEHPWKDLMNTPTVTGQASDSLTAGSRATEPS